MSVASSQPPTKPATLPRMRPAVRAIRTDTVPTSRATREPWIVRDRMSRPNSSAPSQNFAPGRARFSIRLCLPGSAGASHGANTAATTSAATMARPRIASRFL
jgi:hypothetical protein